MTFLSDVSELIGLIFTQLGTDAGSTVQEPAGSVVTLTLPLPPEASTVTVEGLQRRSCSAAAFRRQRVVGPVGNPSPNWRMRFTAHRRAWSDGFAKNLDRLVPKRRREVCCLDGPEGVMGPPPGCRPGGTGKPLSGPRMNPHNGGFPKPGSMGCQLPGSQGCGGAPPFGGSPLSIDGGRIGRRPGGLAGPPPICGRSNHWISVPQTCPGRQVSHGRGDRRPDRAVRNRDRRDSSLAFHSLDQWGRPAFRSRDRPDLLGLRAASPLPILRCVSD